ncbi:MAG: GAF domain-containing protein, partial [Candidatus Atribacteria bacterium]|nr:GAF domain-containing protein [Candidatus Atribacteria bacterium]
DGLTAREKDSFDVFLLDLKLPDMDGIQIIEEIKKNDPDAVVIIFTGYPSVESAQESLRLGAYDYIIKPFTINEISFAVKRAIEFRNLTIANKKLIKELEKHKVKLENKVEEKTRNLAFLYMLGQDISSTLKREEILDIIVDKIFSVLDVEISSILLVDESSGELTIGAARGIDEDTINQTRLKIGEGITGWVLKQKKAILVEDIEKDPRFAKRSKEKYYTHSLISVPLLIKDEVIGVININNKKSREVFTEDDFKLLKGIATESAIAINNAKLFSSLEKTYINTMVALTSAIDAKDHYTKSHSEHITRYAVAIANEMGLSQAEIEEIKQASQLHDLGKIGIHNYILTKPSNLTEEEWDEVKLHSSKGAGILEPLIFSRGVIDLVRQHHERIDGKGYPYGLKDDEIKLGARIIAVADSFDAMSTEKPYRKALSKHDIIEELKRNKGTQFDPKVVEAFLKVLKKKPQIIKGKE